MAQVPLRLLAQVLGTTPEAVKAQIGIHGNLVQNGQQTLEDLVSNQIQTISALVLKPPQP